MRVPIGWLREHVDVPADASAADVAATLVRVGLEEEGVHGGDVRGPVVVGRVLEYADEPQSNGKTIRWCSVEVGESEPRGIVCGANNFDAGDLVVVSLPGAVLAGGFSISARRTYGHVSDGMVCSARELGVGEDAGGILVLTEADPGAVPGADAIPLLGLDDVAVEVNVTPDRGYCLSVRGMAREYAHGARLDVRTALRDPAALVVTPAGPGGVPVELADGAPIAGAPGCDRFVARVVRGLDPGAATPAHVRRRLQQCGVRPISLAVDVTNYVMLLLGQPLHAYDLASLDGGITVRRAGAGERLTTLDDAERVLHPEDLVIADGPGGVRPIGLAGVMGGASTEVGPATTDVLVEAAHFDPVTVARTARRHRLPSEASRRFERGVDPAVQAVAAEVAVRLLVEHGGGTADPEVTDVDRTSPPSAVRMPRDEPRRLVGVDYSDRRVVELLEQVGCAVSVDGSDLVVTPPTWRPDLVQDADLVEEVARLDGYAAIPSVLPTAPPGRGTTVGQRARRSVSRALAESGFVEVLSSPFTGASRHDDLGLPPDDPRRRALRLANPLSDEAPELRTSLLATLPDVVRRNLGRGATDLALFEVGLVTRPDRALPAAPRVGTATRPDDATLAALDAAVPAQPLRVAGLLCGLREPAGWWGQGRRADHGDAVAAALLVAETLHVAVTVEPDPDHPPWHPGRCAALRLADGTLAGHAGELHPRVVAALELPPRTAAFELDLDAVVAAMPEVLPVRPVSPFPVAKEDLAVVVPGDVPAAAVHDALAVGGGDLLEDVRLFDVYAGDQVAQGHRSLAFALRMRAPDRTLTARDTAAVREAALAEASRRVGAVLRGA